MLSCESFLVSHLHCFFFALNFALLGAIAPSAAQFFINSFVYNRNLF